MEVQLIVPPAVPPTERQDFAGRVSLVAVIVRETNRDGLHGQECRKPQSTDDREDDQQPPEPGSGLGRAARGRNLARRCDVAANQRHGHATSTFETAELSPRLRGRPARSAKLNPSPPGLPGYLDVESCA